MTTGGVLRVQQFAIDLDIEDTLGAGDERERLDHMLIVRQEVVRCAHGAARIVSRDAVGDADHVAVHGIDRTRGRARSRRSIAARCPRSLPSSGSERRSPVRVEVKQVRLRRVAGQLW